MTSLSTEDCERQLNLWVMDHYSHLLSRIGSDRFKLVPPLYRRGRNAVRNVLKGRLVKEGPDTKIIAVSVLPVQVVAIRIFFLVGGFSYALLFGWQSGWVNGDVAVDGTDIAISLAFAAFGLIGSQSLGGRFKKKARWAEEEMARRLIAKGANGVQLAI
ncbi:hypothetical protein [Parvularcula maris]|uniref:Uncharacterized protein n=1 Tax=Parvularcula maris TaxID=2965077 RepID=A0A9X2RGY0_9PROT|nr:hypothetical protein [Parvularcula maris]MCQ8184365.1 hypothetical protein [Parvularcula maris]